MIYHTYGSTGIEVSALGCGGMRFANPQDIETNAALVKTAYQAGINYFDTAPVYCEDKSENIYGAALKEMLKTRAAKPFYVSTKSMKSEPKEVRKNLENSLKRLGLDYIDFYHLWCVMSLDDYNSRRAKGAIKEFEKLKDEGLIKHICVSTHMTGADIGKMLDDYPFEGVTLGYSVMNFAYRDAGLDAAAKSGCGVVVMNPLGGGIIPANRQRFEFVKTRQEETVVAAALRFLINDKRITVALVGFSEDKHLAEAISAVDGYKPIVPEVIAKIRSRLHDSFNELCTACGYCDNCPEQIPVPKMMDAYNLYKLSGNALDMINRLRWHWGIEPESEYIRKCDRCGQCEQACTQKLPICERLKKIRNEVEKFIRTSLDTD